MKEKLYIDSSIPSYLTAKPSHDLVQYSMQLLSLEWWDEYSAHYDAYISAAVIQELSQGDAEAAAHRLKAVADIELLGISKNTMTFAEELLQAVNLPKAMIMDAIHVALCLENGISYLVTWNFKHLANAAVRRKISLYCAKHDYAPLTICTPQELLEAWDDKT